MNKYNSKAKPSKAGARTLIPQAQVKPFEIRPEKIALFKQSNPTTLSTKDFHVWLNWWQTNFTTDDYFKYVSTLVYSAVLKTEIQPTFCWKSLIIIYYSLSSIFVL